MAQYVKHNQRERPQAKSEGGNEVPTTAVRLVGVTFG